MKDSPQPPHPAKQQRYYMKAAKYKPRPPVVPKKPQQPLQAPVAQPIKRETSPPTENINTLLFKAQSSARELEKNNQRVKIQPKVERHRQMSMGQDDDAHMDERTFCNKEATAIKLKKETAWRMEYDRIKQKEVEQQLEHERKPRRKPDIQLEKEQLEKEQISWKWFQKEKEIHDRGNQSATNIFNEKIRKRRSQDEVALRQEMTIELDNALKCHHQKMFKHKMQLKEEEEKYLERKKQMEEEQAKYLERKKSQEVALAEMAQTASNITNHYEEKYFGTPPNQTSNVASRRHARIPPVRPRKRQTTDPYQRLTQETATIMFKMNLNGESDSAATPALNDQAKSETLSGSNSLYPALPGSMEWSKNVRGR